VPIGGGIGSHGAHGKVYPWTESASGVANPADPIRAANPGLGASLCLNEGTGDLWTYEYECPYTASYPAGPRVTPLVHEGKVYTLGTEGNLVCLAANDGTLVWQRDFKKDFYVKTPMWGFSAHPLIEGNRLICLAAGDGSTAVAFDKDTGKEIWRALGAKEPGYAPPMVHEFAGKRQLIVWHPEGVNSLDPNTGHTNWTYPITPSVRFGMSISTPRKVGDLLFLTSFYNGSLLLRVGTNGPSLVWASKKISEKDTDGLHTVMATPLIENGYIYGPCSYGQFRCLELLTGNRVWETFAPTSGKSERWGNAFIVKNDDRSFLFSEKGDLIIARLAPAGYDEITVPGSLNPPTATPAATSSGLIPPSRTAASTPATTKKSSASLLPPNSGHGS